MALDIFSAGRNERVAIMIDDLRLDAMGMHYPSYEPTAQPITPPVKPPTLSIKKTMLAHMCRDITGQVVGRTLGLPDSSLQHQTKLGTKNR
jgi:hypothetical protein